MNHARSGLLLIRKNTKRFLERLPTFFFFFFKKKTFLLHPTLTNFTQRERKTCDANGLVSLVSIIVYIHSLGKKFFCTCLKNEEHEMILSYEKPCNEKMRE